MALTQIALQMKRKHRPTQAPPAASMATPAYYPPAPSEASRHYLQIRYVQDQTNYCLPYITHRSIKIRTLPFLTIHNVQHSRGVQKTSSPSLAQVSILDTPHPYRRGVPDV